MSKAERSRAYPVPVEQCFEALLVAAEKTQVRIESKNPEARAIDISWQVMDSRALVRATCTVDDEDASRVQLMYDSDLVPFSRRPSMGLIVPASVTTQMDALLATLGVELGIEEDIQRMQAEERRQKAPTEWSSVVGLGVLLGMIVGLVALFVHAGDLPELCVPIAGGGACSVFIDRVKPFVRFVILAVVSVLTYVLVFQLFAH